MEVLRGRENARRRTRPPVPPDPAPSTLRRALGTPGTRPRPPTRVSHPERVGRLRGVGRDRSGRPYGCLPAGRRSLTPGPGEGPRRRRPCRAGGLSGRWPGARPREPSAPIRVASPAAPPRALRGASRVRGGRRAYLGHPAAAAVPGLPARVPVPVAPRLPQLGGRRLIQAPPSGPAAAKRAAPGRPSRAARWPPARRAPRVPARLPCARGRPPSPLPSRRAAESPAAQALLLRRPEAASAGAAHERAKSMQLRRGRGPRRQRRPLPAAGVEGCLPPPGLKALVGKDTDVSMFASIPGKGEKLWKFPVWLPSRAMILQLCPPRGALGVPPRPRRGAVPPSSPKTLFSRGSGGGGGGRIPGCGERRAPGRFITTANGAVLLPFCSVS